MSDAMTPSRCGFANPPADGTAEREVIDRFRDFLSEGWVPARRGQPLPRRSAAQMYRFHYQIWRIGNATAPRTPEEE